MINTLRLLSGSLRQVMPGGPGLSISDDKERFGWPCPWWGVAIRGNFPQRLDSEHALSIAEANLRLELNILVNLIERKRTVNGE